MQEDILSPLVTKKVYSENAIRIGTFLGGPLVTGYLMAENYKQLGETSKVKLTWILSILATIVVFTIAFLLPTNTQTRIIPIIYSAAAFYLVKNLQGNQIKAHLENGGQTYSAWRAVLVGVICLVVLLLILFGGFLMMDLVKPTA
jgi:heme/copper-type cytochrome/quinol oxidase subunit 4